MDGVHCLLAVFLLHQNGDADLGSGDHVDVDAHVVQALEHLGSHARVGHHAGADDGDDAHMDFLSYGCGFNR